MNSASVEHVISGVEFSINLFNANMRWVVILKGNRCDKIVHKFLSMCAVPAIIAINCSGVKMPCNDSVSKKSSIVLFYHKLRIAVYNKIT